jgi:hypothetical protein
LSHEHEQTEAYKAARVAAVGDLGLRGKKADAYALAQVCDLAIGDEVAYFRGVETQKGDDGEGRHALHEHVLMTFDAVRRFKSTCPPACVERRTGPKVPRNRRVTTCGTHDGFGKCLKALLLRHGYGHSFDLKVSVGEESSNRMLSAYCSKYVTKAVADRTDVPWERMDLGPADEPPSVDVNTGEVLSVDDVQDRTTWHRESAEVIGYETVTISEREHFHGPGCSANCVGGELPGFYVVKRAVYSDYVVEWSDVRAFRRVALSEPYDPRKHGPRTYRTWTKSHSWGCTMKDVKAQRRAWALANTPALDGDEWARRWANKPPADEIEGNPTEGRSSPP